MTQTTEKPPLMKWSLDRYHELVKTGVLEDCRVELLNGEIVEMSPVDPVHDDTQEALVEYLRTKLGARARVREAKAVTLPTIASRFRIFRWCGLSATAITTPTRKMCI
jgi:Uma2 family endonuclease